MKFYNYLHIIIILIFSIPSVGQYDPGNPTGNPLIQDEIDSWSDPDEEPNHEILLAESLIRASNIDFVKLEEHPDRLFKKSYKNGKVQGWEIIAQRIDYFILCGNDYNRGKCKCKDDLFIFIPEKRLVKTIHPWYAPPFHTKTRLIKTINELTSDSLDEKDFDRYCELIEYLRNE